MTYDATGQTSRREILKLGAGAAAFASTAIWGSDSFAQAVQGKTIGFTMSFSNWWPASAGRGTDAPA